MVEKKTWVSVAALAAGLGWSLGVMGGVIAVGGVLFGAVNLLCLTVSALPWALGRAGLIGDDAPAEAIPLQRVVYSPRTRDDAQDLFEFIREEGVSVPLSKVPMVESGHFFIEDLEYTQEDTGSFYFNPEEVAQRIVAGLDEIVDGGDRSEFPSVDVDMAFDGWSMPEEMPLESMTVEARIKALEAAIRADEDRHHGALAKSR